MNSATGQWLTETNTLISSEIYYSNTKIIAYIQHGTIRPTQPQAQSLHYFYFALLILVKYCDY